MLAATFAVASAVWWIAGCATPLGPGFVIEKQAIRVAFDASEPPRIEVSADYDLQNAGNRALDSLEIRLPGHRQFQVTGISVTWDDSAVPVEATAANPRNTLLPLPQQWDVSARHHLRVSFFIERPAEGERDLSFAGDAFFLPAAGWSPELPLVRGPFGFGGTPPRAWQLTVEVPADFLVHTGGSEPKTTRRAGQLTYEVTERPADRYPFVVAGRYSAASFSSGGQKINIWTRGKIASGELQREVVSFRRAIDAYNRVFGPRGKGSLAFWIVECPAVPGCFTGTNPINARILGDPQIASTQMISLDSLLFEPGGTAAGFSVAAPALAASWMGYGENPGFYEQRPPLSSFPVFATAIGKEAESGPEAREAMIARALEIVSESNGRKPESDEVVRAKSFLFFYGLQERYGEDAFWSAVRHMLHARRGRGFDLDDLIAALEQETHQNVAEFVRLWMKRPGVPAEFRDRHPEPSAAAANSREAMP